MSLRPCVEHQRTVSLRDVRRQLGGLGLPDRVEIAGVRVFIDRTAQHLGGARSWFACPRCQRRCADLYVCYDLLACRCCHGLAYRSQRLRPADRWRQAAFDLYRLVNVDYATKKAGPKPDGMRWRRYLTLLNRAREFDARAVGTSLELFGRRFPNFQKASWR